MHAMLSISDQPSGINGPNLDDAYNRFAHRDRGRSSNTNRTKNTTTSSTYCSCGDAELDELTPREREVLQLDRARLHARRSPRAFTSP